jgi:predicted P-loop ATPase
MSAHAYTGADLERIAKQLGGATKTGNGFDCQCPAHDDREPSLSLSVKDGKLLWICRAGCSQEAVQEALKRAGVLPNGDAEPKARRKGLGPIVATYDYTDERGGLLFQVTRHEPKDFRQRRPDPKGKDGWTWKLGTTRRVLYHLPEVLAAENVIVTEGEKDADRLRSLGFTATTNPGGAASDKQKGKKWLSAHSDALAGKGVTIIGDNDEQGRKHVETVARDLNGKAASVKVLRLDGLPEKGDVSDWLDAGHSADELRELIAKAPAWQPRPDAWRDTLILKEKGYPRPVEANVVKALRGDPAFVGRLRLNQLTEAAECSVLPWCPAEPWRAWTDTDDIELAIWCQERGVPVKPSTCAAAVQSVAAKSPVHPVRDYLRGVRWDGTGRLDTWLTAYLGVEPWGEAEKAKKASQHYIAAIGSKWLISAVARAFDPGCKVDTALIQEGEQGEGKSTAFEALVPDPAWYTDGIADLGTKDSAQDLRGKWIIELPEMSAMHRSEVERVKSFMSRRIDHYRPSYGRRTQDFPRQCVFGGTTNGDAYLQDDTGNRRFWPARTGKIKIGDLKRDRDQLWAEAVHRYRAKETWWLDSEAEGLAVGEQARRRIMDVWEDPVLAYTDGLDKVQIAAILADRLNILVERQTQRDANRVASILKANGWERFKDRDGKERTWRYRRKAKPDPSPEPPPEPGPTTEPPPSSDEAGLGGDASPDAGGATLGPKPQNGPEVGPTGTKKSSNGAGGPSGPSGPSNFPYADAQMDGAMAHDDAHHARATLQESGGSSGSTGTTRTNAGFFGPGGPSMSLPWADWSQWMARVNRAPPGDGQRREVAAWAAAAGAAVSATTLVLPPDLPAEPALDWLKGAAAMVGLEVRVGGRP